MIGDGLFPQTPAACRKRILGFLALKARRSLLDAKSGLLALDRRMCWREARADDASPLSLSFSLAIGPREERGSRMKQETLGAMISACIVQSAGPGGGLPERPEHAVVPPLAPQAGAADVSGRERGFEVERDGPRPAQPA